MRVGRLKNGKAAGKYEITEEMIRDEGDKVVDWIRRLCDMTFVSDVVPEGCRYMIVPP